MTSHAELKGSDGEVVAYRRREPRTTGPEVFWLSGFKSDMGGTKAVALDAWAARTGRGYTRFDYFGHGASSGTFRDGTITRWRNNAIEAFDALTKGPQILVGSSMGAWIATLLALARPDRIAGIVYIAPALDFTEELIWARLPADARKDIVDKGEWLRPSAYDPDPYPITRGLIEDGRKHLLLGAPIAIACPIRILQGMADPDVPWTHAMRLVERLTSKNVVVHLIKNGDHRLSTPEELARLERTIEELIAATAR